MCRVNESPFKNLPEAKYEHTLLNNKYTASKDTIASNIIIPIYQQLENNTDPKDCPNLCTIAANAASTRGCCEYRVQGKQCVWTSANGVPYLAPEFREKDAKNAMDSKAVLCSSGLNDIS